MNMWKKTSSIVVVVFFFACQQINAQYSDFKVWSSIEVSTDLTKDLKADLEIGQRFKENSSRYDRSLVTGSLEYNVFGDFDIQAGYRFLVVQDDEMNIESRYRLHGDIKWKYRLDAFTFRLKERIQYGFDDLSAINESRSNKVTNRSKLGLEYSIFGSPIALYSSYELFIGLNNPDGIFPSAHRANAGVKYTLTPRLDMDLSYMLDKEVNRVNPLTSHIALIGLSYKL